MKIGVPKEIKNNENRVGMTPAGVAELVKRGHSVTVQHTAGEGSGFSDEDYVAAGAVIAPTIEETYAAADMIVKVKEPIEPEYPLVKEGQLVFTYFHFASDLELTKAMIDRKGVCLAYETVQTKDGALPLLIPMSEVAGRMATINGAYFLQKTKGGKGKLICGVPGVKPVKVLVLGGGIVGQAAARVAAGMGANVVIADISLPRLRELSLSMPANVDTLYSSAHNIRKELPDTEFGIGARRQGSPPHHPRHAETDGTRLRAGRRGHRPGRLLRDLPSYHPQQSRLRGGRHRTLLCGQYSGGRTQYLYLCPDQCHVEICDCTGRQGMAKGVRGGPRTESRTEYRGR